MYLYVIQCGISRYYKIGRSINPDQRLSTLQAANPMLLQYTVVAKIPDEMAIEECLHKYYNEHRIRNEWFDLDDQDIEDIIAYLAQYKIVFPKMKRKKLRAYREATVKIPKKM